VTPLLVLLDVDGTLFLTDDPLAGQALRETLTERFGVELPEDAIERVDHRGQTALRIAELIREKALHLTREEVPHAISAEVEELTEKVVRVTLYVETESQKQIVVGRGGAIVKEIGTRARPEIEQLLDRPIFLDLTVKARPKWRSDLAMLERLGI